MIIIICQLEASMPCCDFELKDLTKFNYIDKCLIDLEHYITLEKAHDSNWNVTIEFRSKSDLKLFGSKMNGKDFELKIIDLVANGPIMTVDELAAALNKDPKLLKTQLLAAGYGKLKS